LGTRYTRVLDHWPCAKRIQKRAARMMISAQRPIQTPVRPQCQGKGFSMMWPLGSGIEMPLKA